MRARLDMKARIKELIERVTGFGFMPREAEEENVFFFWFMLFIIGFWTVFFILLDYFFGVK
jgi:hypothetical protein